MQDIVSVLDALCDKVGIAIDWSSENIAPQLEAFVARYGTYLAASSIQHLRPCAECAVYRRGSDRHSSYLSELPERNLGQRRRLVW